MGLCAANRKFFFEMNKNSAKAWHMTGGLTHRKAPLMIAVPAKCNYLACRNHINITKETPAAR
jgi:hypothetical protein